MDFNGNVSGLRYLVTLFGQLFLIGYIAMLLTNLVFWLVEEFQAG